MNELMAEIQLGTPLPRKVVRLVDQHGVCLFKPIARIDCRCGYEAAGKGLGKEPDRWKPNAADEQTGSIGDVSLPGDNRVVTCWMKLRVRLTISIAFPSREQTSTITSLSRRMLLRTKLRNTRRPCMKVREGQKLSYWIALGSYATFCTSFIVCVCSFPMPIKSWFFPNPIVPFVNH